MKPVQLPEHHSPRLQVDNPMLDKPSRETAARDKRREFVRDLSYLQQAVTETKLPELSALLLGMTGCHKMLSTDLVAF